MGLSLTYTRESFIREFETKQLKSRESIKENKLTYFWRSHGLSSEQRQVNSFQHSQRARQSYIVKFRLSN